MLALINLIIRRTRLAFRTPARFALVLRSLPALPVPRHDFDREFEATGAGMRGGECSRKDLNLGGGVGSRLLGFSLTPCPLVTRLGCGSCARRLRAPRRSRLRSDGLADKGPRPARLSPGHLRCLAWPSRLRVLAGLAVSTWPAPGF